MRNPGDTQTAELEGLPPAQPNRSAQAVARAQQGYQGPKERTRCETCRYVMGGFDRDPLRCALGDFPVMRGGLCREWLKD